MPTTYSIQFPGPLFPRLFSLYDNDGNLYYFRYLDGKTGQISLNLPYEGIFYSMDDFSVTRSTPIVLSGFRITLPVPDRNYDYNLDNITVSTGTEEELGRTPARMYYETGSIVVLPVFWTYPEPIREFIIEHEIGHLYYSNETNADLFAVKTFLTRGNNRSMAFYSLSHILHPGKKNEDRLDKVFAILIASN